MDEAEQEKNEKVRKVLSWTVGLLGAAFIAGGIYFPIKNSRQNKEIKTNQEIYLQEEVAFNNKYNTLLNENLSLIDENKSKDLFTQKLTNENSGLKRKLDSLNVYKGKVADYKKTLDGLEFLKIAYDLEKGKNSELETVIKQKRDSIDLLFTKMGYLAEDLENCTFMFNSQKDTTNLLQKYLDIYMIVKTPIKDKHRAKVYLPEGEVFVPEDRAAIKEIKALNKDYKKK